MKEARLPEKTVERLSQYRRILILCYNEGQQHIFSHELAVLMHIKPVQIRRDLMLIGYSGTLRKGYDIKELIAKIGLLLDTTEGQKVAIIGMGNLGRAISSYFNGKRSKLTISAAFDNDPSKINRVISGIKCYSIDDMQKIIKAESIDIAILTIPPEIATNIARDLVLCGIKGILNYTSTPINVSQHVYLEEYDMITSIEKVAFMVKSNNKE